jgi:hypothetical protein
VGFKYFVYYDEQGSITSITNEKRPTGDFLEVEEVEVLDFLNGSKDFTQFKITSLSSGSKQIKLAQQTSQLIYKDFYTLATANGDEQVIVNHNSKKSSWDITVKDNAVEFNLYVCKKNNLNFLIRTIIVPAKNMCSIPFEMQEENNINNLMVLTKKIYKSYGIKNA